MEIIKNNKNIFLFLLLIISIIVIIARYTSSDSTQKINNDIKNKIKYVTSYSKFYTLDECANKYINYLQNQDKNSLMKLLSAEYQEKNNITKNNIIDKLDDLTDSRYSFKTKTIKQEKLKNKKTKYYIYGYLKKDIINTSDLGNDYYLIITINEKNNLFEVTPYNGKIFKEES